MIPMLWGLALVGLGLAFLVYALIQFFLESKTKIGVIQWQET
jgi:hypothetical protein